jgi:hypothetical protein
VTNKSYETDRRLGAMLMSFEWFGKWGDLLGAPEEDALTATVGDTKGHGSDRTI